MSDSQFYFIPNKDCRRCEGRGFVGSFYCAHCLVHAYQAAAQGRDEARAELAEVRERLAYYEEKLGSLTL